MENPVCALVEKQFVTTFPVAVEFQLIGRVFAIHGGRLTEGSPMAGRQDDGPFPSHLGEGVPCPEVVTLSVQAYQWEWGGLPLTRSVMF